MNKTHFGDPCIHCAIPHDDVPIGPCVGDKPPIPIAYKSLGVRWDNVENFLILMSDGTKVDRWSHISNSLPYNYLRYARLDQGLKP